MFTIKVKGNIISVQETEPITSGSVSVYKCQFAFDNSWDGFFRSAVFRCGSMVKTVPLDREDKCDLPWELLEKKHIGLPVEVSVYGSRNETEILPTIWDKLGRVRSGSEPGEDAKAPTPNVYDQLTNVVRVYAEKVTEDYNAIINAARDADAAGGFSALASESAASAKTSANNAAQSATEAEKSANRAQAEAERVTVPAAVGVYNVILTDRATGDRYALVAENGRLAILGVSETLEATDMNFIDTATGTAYELIVESGRLNLKEV